MAENDVISVPPRPVVDAGWCRFVYATSARALAFVSGLEVAGAEADVLDETTAICLLPFQPITL
jgi:hypothetical protein